MMIFSVIKNSVSSEVLLYSGLFFTLSGVSTLIWVKSQKNKRKKLSQLIPNRVVIVTGCDSGIGLTLAYHAAKNGYFVIASCLDDKSEGVAILHENFTDKNLRVFKLDLRNEESVKKFVQDCEEVLMKNPELKLWTVVCNAAICIYSDFFWLTKEEVREVMEVNFFGTVNFVQELKKLLLVHRSKLVLITSDCGSNFSLPGLSIYAASKSAVETWANSFRLEVSQFGIHVTCLRPGDHPNTTNLFGSVVEQFKKLECRMSEEEKNFYGSYLTDIKKEKMSSLKPKKVEIVQDKSLVKEFGKILENDTENLRLIDNQNNFSLKVIHFMLKMLPQKRCDSLIHVLLKTPLWKIRKYPTV